MPTVTPHPLVNPPPAYMDPMSPNTPWSPNPADLAKGVTPPGWMTSGRPGATGYTPPPTGFNMGFGGQHGGPLASLFRTMFSQYQEPTGFMNGNMNQQMSGPFGSMGGAFGNPYGMWGALFGQRTPQQV